MLAIYTAGYSLKEFKGEYLKFVNSLLPVWHSKTGYIQMVWALSIGILLEIDGETLDKLVELVRQDNPEDYLIQHRYPDREIHSNYKFPRPYDFTRKIVEEENPELALLLLREYLMKNGIKAAEMLLGMISIRET